MEEKVKGHVLPMLLCFIKGENERSGHLSLANLKNCSALKKKTKTCPTAKMQEFL
jgi:hypothetical protein